jgi:hypothetical protein
MAVNVVWAVIPGRSMCTTPLSDCSMGVDRAVAALAMVGVSRAYSVAEGGLTDEHLDAGGGLVRVQHHHIQLPARHPCHELMSTGDRCRCVGPYHLSSSRARRPPGDLVMRLVSSFIGKRYRSCPVRCYTVASHY